MLVGNVKRLISCKATVPPSNVHEITYTFRFCHPREGGDPVQTKCLSYFVHDPYFICKEVLNNYSLFLGINIKKINVMLQLSIKSSYLFS
jgi:hypothetical protein